MTNVNAIQISLIEDKNYCLRCLLKNPVTLLSVKYNDYCYLAGQEREVTKKKVKLKDFNATENTRILVPDKALKSPTLSTV